VLLIRDFLSNSKRGVLFSLHALLRFLEIITAIGLVASTTHVILFLFMKLII